MILLCLVQVRQSLPKAAVPRTPYMHAKADQILLISMNRQKNQSHVCLTRYLSIHVFFHLLEQGGEAFPY